MPTPLHDIPLLDLVAYLIETPDSPTHVGALQVYEPVKGGRPAILARVLKGFRGAEVAPPFNYVPLFPPFSRPKWALADDFDPAYHVRHVGLPGPGTEQQLIDLVMDLHAPALERSRPGWIAYVIDGLEEQRFAVYWKVHHAYIDGASAMMRFERATSRDPSDREVRALWSPLFVDQPRAAESAPEPLAALGSWLRAGSRASLDLAGMFGRTLMQAGGRLERDIPLPFSAPRSLFNAPVRAARRLGVGHVALQRLRDVAKHAGVTLNDVALTLVGAALERYAEDRHEAPSRPLVAICPMSIRAEGDTRASTQIAAISISLGEPGSRILERLTQVNASARAAKDEARGVSREALVAYLAVLGGTADLIGKSPLAGLIPPTTNVNVSNVAGPAHRCYLSGAELVASYPVSTLAGGTAINVTFASLSGRMDFAVVTDARAVPDPERITAYLADALDELERACAPAPKRKPKARAKRASRAPS